MKTSTRRTHHLIDIENLIGTSSPSREAVASCWATYSHHFVTNGDQYALACSHHAAERVAFECGNARQLWRSGANGADLELLDVLKYERVAERFDRVFIASGDGIFAEAAAWLASQGVEVVVVSRPQSLSTKLRLAAEHVVLLPTTTLRLPAQQEAA
jgi:hypothetical protein